MLLYTAESTGRSIELAVLLTLLHCDTSISTSDHRYECMGRFRPHQVATVIMSDQPVYLALGCAVPPLCRATRVGLFWYQQYIASGRETGGRNSKKCHGNNKDTCF